jgi:hypothetical protein
MHTFDCTMKYNRESSERNVLHSTCLGDPVPQLPVHGGNIELLDTLMAKLGHKHVDLLKIDIKGVRMNVCLCMYVYVCVFCVSACTA